MTTTRITDLLQNQYDRQAWKNFLLDIIGDQYFQPLREPVEEKRSDSINRIAKKITRYANLETSDGKTLPIFEVILQDNVVIERNRVTVNELIRNLIRSKGREGALVTFAYSKEQSKKEWRFSFIAHEESFFFEEEDLVKTNPKRYTYVFGTPETHRTAIHRFELLKKSEKSIQDLMEAFAVEKLSKAFFNQYREHYGRFIAYLTGKDENDKPVGEAAVYLDTLFNGDDKKARDFVKKMLGRIVFLYFIQRKGWLGVPLNGKWGEGDPNFMAEFFKASGGDENFYPLFLDRLFYETLSTKRPNDEIELIEGEPYRIPYLNGGLFERDDTLASNGIITFPPELFRDLFNFLGAYNFTIYESSPDEHTVAVDPEMLGHIFENLLEDNKDKGAFYTPKAIVHYMCQESLIEYLLTRLDNEVERAQLEDFIKHKHANDAIVQFAERIDQLLDTVKICDPAIGSGAFPMGLLLEIYNAKLLLFDHVKNKKFHPKDLESGNYHYQIKENIIQNSIYGVDIEEGAVDIARLRFWLSLVVDENEPKPLPNLDFKIVVGDSLLPKFEDQVIEIDWTKKQATSKTQKYVDNIHQLLREIVERQQDYFHPRGDKNILKAEIRNRKIDLLVNQLMLNRIVFSEQTADTGDLFSKSKTVQQVERDLKLKKYDNLIKKLQKLKNTNKPFHHFDWKLDFPNVMNEQVAERVKFDIVIANPPYMRVQEIARTQKKTKRDLEAKYAVAKKSYDLANIFFELAVNISNQQASNCYIFPHKFFNSSSTEVFRDYLWEGKYVDRVIHFGANMIFNEADTYTCITHFSPRKNEGFELMKLDFGENWRKALDRLELSFISYEDLAEVSKLYGSNQWIFFSSKAAFKAFKKIYANSDFFYKSLDCFVGLQTSKDKLYLITVSKEDTDYIYGTNKLDDEVHQLEKEFFKPMLKGKDVHRYAKLKTDLFVFFPYILENDKAEVVELETLRDNFPKTYEYVKKYEKIFKGREREKAGRMKHWYAYIYPKNLIKFEQPKLSSMEICTKYPNVTLNLENLYHNTKVYSWVKKDTVKESYEYFLGIANSKLLWWFLKNTGDTLRGDARTLKTNYLNPFPLPKQVSERTDMAFQEIVRKTLYQKKEGIDTQALEAEIDKMVFKLYDLSYEEVLEVDPEFSISRNEYEKYRLPA